MTARSDVESKLQLWHKLDQNPVEFWQYFGSKMAIKTQNKCANKQPNHVRIALQNSRKNLVEFPL